MPRNRKGVKLPNPNKGIEIQPDNKMEITEKTKDDNIEEYYSSTSDSSDQETQTIKKLKSNQQIDKKITYDQKDVGPYVVIATKKNAKPFHLSKLLKKMFLKNFSIDQLNNSRLKIIFKDYMEANKLINHPLISTEYVLVIPHMNIFTIGMLRGVPLDMNETEILNNVESEIRIFNVERMSKWDNVNKIKIPTENIKIRFRATKIPESIKIYNINMKVIYFIPQPLFCINCQNYGHHKANCKGTARCKICSEPEVVDDIPHTCKGLEKCKYCGDGHTTNKFKECTEREKQFNIKKIMTLKKIDYKTAIKHLYSSIPIKNMDNFPPLSWENHNQVKLQEMEKQINILKIENGKNNTTLNEIKQLFSNVANDKLNNDVILIKIGEILNTN